MMNTGLEKGKGVLRYVYKRKDKIVVTPEGSEGDCSRRVVLDDNFEITGDRRKLF